MHKVLLTGITGFLGSHIAEILIRNKIHVIGLKRPDSNTWRCKNFFEDVNWIDIDDNWKTKIQDASPQIFIHCAWSGVEAIDRDSWSKQFQNIHLLTDLIEVAELISLKKFLFLGSQAEYGTTYQKVTEDYPTNSNTAYSSIKLACLQVFKEYCTQKNIDWLWLRVFPVFGEKENDNWLIPSMINKMQTEDQIDCTAAIQRYAYLYVKDFAEIIYNLLIKHVDSGIYNISSTQSQMLKSVIEQIKQQLNSRCNLNFGALQYRQGQSMHIEGDISKITGQIGPIEFTDFKIALYNTIIYYTSKRI